ncbi:MAG TPA: formylmethanofuran dehydrogenase subunit B [Methanothrix sp.]|nr:formylmethanofuran dehydrogenase subunit B [Methanothrix sp.]
MAICTGCSLLCQDIEADVSDGRLSKAKNLCRKGHGHFQASFSERTFPMIGRKQVDLNQAIARAAEILRSAKSPLLFGWSNSTLEAQRVGISLAEKLGATIDDTSTFCQDSLMESILSGNLPSSTLDDVRNYADTSIFWGADPSNSHPRHLSRFSYYPRGEKRQKSYEEERTCLVVDVRMSATAALCKENLYRVSPGGDAEFIEAIISVLEGKIPRVGDKKKMIELGGLLKKTEWGAIFPGPGLVYSLQGNMEILERLLARLNEITVFKVVPMVGHFNTRGFNELLKEKTGHVNRVSFKGGEIAHGPEQSVMAAAKSCDAALIVGSDPLSSLPFGTAQALARLPLIAIDPHRSLTTDAAEVVIPSAISGLEAGGTAVRTDGVKIEFEPIIEAGIPADEQILKRIMEAI